jgi:flagellar biosynthesis protein FlhA
LLLAPLADALLDRIGEVRRAVAGDIGIVMPGVRLRDDLAREGPTYAIRVRDVVAGTGRLRLERVLAVADETILRRLGGELVREPVYGMPGAWLAPAERERAMAEGALVFDPIGVVGSHLAEIVRTHAAALLGRQELHTLVEHLRASVPSLVKELGTEALPFATVHRVFEMLLAEGAWPRDTIATFEALVDASATTRDPRALAEAVRHRIVPMQLRRRATHALDALIVEPGFDAELAAWLVDGTLAPQPDTALHVRATASEYVTRVPRERAAVVCTATLRAALAEFLSRFGLRVDVFAYGEIPPEFELRPALVLERANATSP